MNLTIRNLDPALVARLRARAERAGRTLQAELQLLIEEEARRDIAREEAVAEIRKMRERVRRRPGRGKAEDSTTIIRKLRNSR